jgi:CheY-like chemotaxis protein
VPVVLVTSHSEPEDVADGLRRGAHDYLRKPFEQPRARRARARGDADQGAAR